MFIKNNLNATRYVRLAVRGATLLVLLTSSVAALVADLHIRQAATKNLDQTVDVAGDQIVNRAEHYVDIMYSSRSLVLNHPEVNQAQWDNFFRDQKTLERYPGISTITYLEFFDDSEKQVFLNTMRAQEYFGGQSFSIKPAGSRPHYAIVRFVSSNNDVKGSFGFDVYSGDSQRQAMDIAASSGKPQATAPYELATGYQGFAAFLPVYMHDRLEGFSLLSFRTNDFIKAVLPQYSGVDYKITDITDSGSSKDLYRSEDWRDNAQLMRSDTVNVLGRSWQITYAADSSYQVSRVTRAVPLFIVIVGLSISVPLFISNQILRSKK